MIDFSVLLYLISVQKFSVCQVVWLHFVQFLTKISKYITSSLNQPTTPLMTQYLWCNAATVEAQPNSRNLSVICCCRQFLGYRAKCLFPLLSFPLSFPLGFLFPKEGWPFLQLLEYVNGLPLLWSLGATGARVSVFLCFCFLFLCFP